MSRGFSWQWPLLIGGRALFASGAVFRRDQPNPDSFPVHLEHEYQRKGALQLFAVFDTRTGKVTGILRRRAAGGIYRATREDRSRNDPRR